MSIIKNLMLAAILGMGMSTITAAETQEAKIEIADLPAAVSEGFSASVPGAEIKSAKKLTGNSTRYQIKYKGDDGKEHQITIGEDGKPTRAKKTETK